MRFGGCLVTDGYGRPAFTADNVYNRAELLREGIDDAGAQSSLRHISAITSNARPIVRNRKLPVVAIDLVGNDNPAIFLVFGERMLERVEHTFRNDEPYAHRIAGRYRVPVTDDLHRDGAAVTDHRLCQCLA